MGNALQHQVDVFEKSLNADIILDLASTGTGKTKAGLTVLLHHPNQNAIYIAPTNALIEQQRKAAEKFVKEAGLPHIVKSASAREIKNWSDEKVGKRSGEKLYNLLRNPATIFPEVGANRPILLVTNPDIFYYATFFAYNKLDRDNIASSFYSQFSTVIFDEFHLYDAKQLVGLLFYLAYYHVFGFFKNQRKVVLLTATPEPACEAALQSLANQDVKIAKISGENENSQLLPSQTAVNLELRPKPDRDDLLQEIANEIVKRSHEKPKHYGAVILDAKINVDDLAKILDKRGLEGKFGRITGSTPQIDRKSAAQKQIILATSTVDVGFNFERDVETTRQNLDWLIFSARDRAAFWQRLGRVGRVLGKTQTDISSDAIAYLPDTAWEQGLPSLDTSGGRNALRQTLETLSCLDKPFLHAYWRSEAFLEVARPLLQLENQLQNLAGSEHIPQLFNNLREILGGKRDWEHYRHRMKVLLGAENISKTKIDKLKKDWKFLPGGQAFVSIYLKANYPEDWEDIQAKRTTLANYEPLFAENKEAVEDLKNFAELWKASYSPLFQFRDSLFDNLQIYDPHGLLLDESEKTILDPIHLLRYYEFERQDEGIIVHSRAKDIYEITFRLNYHDSSQDFVNTQLNKLTAFKNIQIKRQVGGATRPTPLLKQLEKDFFPGIIVCPRTNAAAIFQLRKEGISYYPITIDCDDGSKEYVILTGLSGILAIAMKFKQLKLPDDECFIA
ncbi:MAG: type I-D CRISPR-associated helicase Cas3' [Richelia sp. RM1_1_1]|nr:type I-D CRISPR-associated helicase Cas3' [Richelia sp. RM1_1_1]